MTVNVGKRLIGTVTSQRKTWCSACCTMAMWTAQTLLKFWWSDGVLVVSTSDVKSAAVWAHTGQS